MDERLGLTRGTDNVKDEKGMVVGWRSKYKKGKDGSRLPPGEFGRGYVSRRMRRRKTSCFNHTFNQWLLSFHLLIIKNQPLWTLVCVFFLRPY